MTVLEIRDAYRTHGDGEAAVHALRGVSLTVRPGEMVAVMGPSGSGKSTLLNLAGGLDRPTRGEVSVEGRQLRTLSKRQLAAMRRRSIGYVFQDLNLLPSLTAVENIALPLELDGTGVRPARRLALAALAEVGLAGLGARFPDEMSGGQQQRVAIARALAMRPELLLFDEPTSALDPEMVGEVLDVMVRLREEGMTMIVVSHEMGFARAAADRVVFISDGLVVEDKAPDLFFSAPEHERTRQFLDRIL